MDQFNKRQLQIMDVASRLAATGGLHYATTRRIAAEIGISEPAIYRHFANKQAIFMGLLDLFFQRRAMFISADVPQDPSPVKLLNATLRSSLKGFQDHPAAAAVIFSDDLFHSEPALRDKVSGIMSNNLNQLTGLLRNAQVAALIRADIPPEELAKVIIATLRYHVQEWRRSDFSFNIAESGKSLLNTISALLKAID